MEKLWGVYNTFEDSKIIENLEEFEVWKKINGLGGAIFWAMHDAGKPWAVNVSENDLINAQYNLEYLVYSTKRFGVEFSKEPSASEHVEKSQSFNAWFRFWHDHFSKMAPEVYNQLVDDKFCGKDISKYMPVGNWRDLLEKSKQKKI